MRKLSFPVLVSLFLCVMFFRLISNYSDRFESVNNDYKNGCAINLNENTSYLDIKDILLKYKYVSEPEDATFVAQQIKDKFILAAGDSYNDLGMINASKAGFLFKSTEQIKKDNPNLGAFEEYDDLYNAIINAL